MASLLLVIRDFIEPLGPDTDKHVSRYLREFFDKLHRSRRGQGSRRRGRTYWQVPPAARARTAGHRA
jgi:hypothetical protein